MKLVIKVQNLDEADCFSPFANALRKSLSVLHQARGKWQCSQSKKIKPTLHRLKLTLCHLMLVVEELGKYIPIAGRKMDGFIPFHKGISEKEVKHEQPHARFEFRSPISFRTVIAFIFLRIFADPNITRDWKFSIVLELLSKLNE